MPHSEWEDEEMDIENAPEMDIEAFQNGCQHFESSQSARERREHDLELLLLRKRSKIDCVSKEGEALPTNPLPRWRLLTLDEKVPLVPAPNGTFINFRTEISKPLYIENNVGFDTADPYMRATTKGYNALHDPHLKYFFQTQPNLFKRLVQLGLLTREGQVICTLADLNGYRQYLGRIHKLQVALAQRKQDDWDDCQKKQKKEMDDAILKEIRLKRNEIRLMRRLKILHDHERRIQLLRAKWRDHPSTVISEKRSHDQAISKRIRELKRYKVARRLKALRDDQQKRIKRIVLHIICEEDFAARLRQYLCAEKFVNQQADLKSFSENKRRYQEDKLRYHRALLRRDAIERKCRIENRKMRYTLLAEKQKEMALRNSSQVKNKMVRDMYLMEKYGRHWRNVTLRAHQDGFHQSSWRVRNALQDENKRLQSLVKREGVRFTNLLDNLFIGRKQARTDPLKGADDETRAVVQEVMGEVVSATYADLISSLTKCVVNYVTDEAEKRILDYICREGIDPKDLQKPAIPVRKRNQIHLEPPQRPCSGPCAQFGHGDDWALKCGKMTQELYNIRKELKKTIKKKLSSKLRKALRTDDGWQKLRENVSRVESDTEINTAIDTVAGITMDRVSPNPANPKMQKDFTDYATNKIVKSLSQGLEPVYLQQNKRSSDEVSKQRADVPPQDAGAIEALPRKKSTPKAPKEPRRSDEIKQARKSAESADNLSTKTVLNEPIVNEDDFVVAPEIQETPPFSDAEEGKEPEMEGISVEEPVVPAKEPVAPAEEPKKAISVEKSVAPPKEKPREEISVVVPIADETPKTAPVVNSVEEDSDQYEDAVPSLVEKPGPSNVPVADSVEETKLDHYDDAVTSPVEKPGPATVATTKPDDGTPPYKQVGKEKPSISAKPDVIPAQKTADDERPASLPETLKVSNTEPVRDTVPKVERPVEKVEPAKQELNNISPPLDLEPEIISVEKPVEPKQKPIETISSVVPIASETPNAEPVVETVEETIPDQYEEEVSPVVEKPEPVSIPTKKSEEIPARNEADEGKPAPVPEIPKVIEPEPVTDTVPTIEKRMEEAVPEQQELGTVSSAEYLEPETAAPVTEEVPTAAPVMGAVENAAHHYEDEVPPLVEKPEPEISPIKKPEDIPIRKEADNEKPAPPPETLKISEDEPGTDTVTEIEKPLEEVEPEKQELDTVSPEDLEPDEFPTVVPVAEETPTTRPVVDTTVEENTEQYEDAVPSLVETSEPGSLPVVDTVEETILDHHEDEVSPLVEKPEPESVSTTMPDAIPVQKEVDEGKPASLPETSTVSEPEPVTDTVPRFQRSVEDVEAGTEEDENVLTEELEEPEEISVQKPVAPKEKPSEAILVEVPIVDEVPSTAPAVDTLEDSTLDQYEDEGQPLAETLEPESISTKPDADIPAQSLADDRKPTSLPELPTVSQIEPDTDTVPSFQRSVQEVVAGNQEIDTVSTEDVEESAEIPIGSSPISTSTISQVPLGDAGQISDSALDVSSDARQISDVAPLDVPSDARQISDVALVVPSDARQISGFALDIPSDVGQISSDFTPGVPSDMKIADEGQPISGPSISPSGDWSECLSQRASEVVAAALCAACGKMHGSPSNQPSTESICDDAKNVESQASDLARRALEQACAAWAHGSPSDQNSTTSICDDSVNLDSVASEIAKRALEHACAAQPGSEESSESICDDNVNIEFVAGDIARRALENACTSEKPVDRGQVSSGDWSTCVSAKASDLVGTAICAACGQIHTVDQEGIQNTGDDAGISQNTAAAISARRQASQDRFKPHVRIISGERLRDTRPVELQYSTETVNIRIPTDDESLGPSTAEILVAPRLLPTRSELTRELTPSEFRDMTYQLDPSTSTMQSMTRAKGKLDVHDGKTSTFPSLAPSQFPVPSRSSTEIHDADFRHAGNVIPSQVRTEVQAQLRLIRAEVDELTRTLREAGVLPDTDAQTKK